MEFDSKKGYLDERTDELSINVIVEIGTFFHYYSKPHFCSKYYY